MNKCVNKSSKEFIELVRQSGLNPAILAAKMGAYMTSKDTDEWPSLEELGIAPAINPISLEEVLEKYPELTETTTEEETLISDLSNPDRLTALKEQMIKSLEARYERNRRFKNASRDDLIKQEELIKKINELETKQSIALFIEQASQSTNKVFNTWKDQYRDKVNAIISGKSDKSLKDVLKPGLLYIWKDYISTYDDMDDYVNYMTENGLIDIDSEEHKKLLLVSKKKDTIKSLYTTYGQQILAEELTPYYNEIYKKFENNKRKVYRSLPEVEKAKYTEEQYIDMQKDLEATNLRQQTINLLQGELITASKDIGYMTRWFASALETSDPIFAALVEKFQFKEIERRTEKILPMREKLVHSLRRLEEYAKSKTNFKQLYNSILEKDEKGNLTGKHVDRFGSAFWSAYDKFKADTAANIKLDDDERGKEIKAWLNKNAPLRRTEFNTDKWINIDALHKEGVISDEELAVLEENEMTYDFQSYWDLKESGRLSAETSKILSDWQFDNIWNYRDPDAKWSSKNKSWYEFKRLPKHDSTVELFDLLLEIKNEANELLPPSMRLKHGDLPNILASNEERLVDGDVMGAFKNAIARQLDVLVDDDTRGNQPLEDAQGNKIHMVPIYYTGKTNTKVGDEWQYDPTKQSYDLASIFFRYYDMATLHNIRNEMKVEAEMAKYFVQNRDITLIDDKGNPVKKTKGQVTKGTNQTQEKLKNRVAEQLTDWIEENIYGIKELGLGQANILGLKVDNAKAAKLLSKYTSLSVMALNFKTAVSNVMMGEMQQIGESFAGQHMTKKSLHKATIMYDKNFAGIVADTTSRLPKNIVSLLDEEFQISMESLDPKFKDSNRIKQVAKTSSLYVMLRMGDHWMKNRFFLGMLNEKKAYDKNGVELGSILDMYTAKDSKLILDSRVDLDKSKWNKEDKYRFTMKVQGVLSGIHQEISPLGRAAAERNALLGLALLFRKFIAPGVARRYKKKSYVERVGDYTEGYYRTTGRFFNNIRKELKIYKFAVLSENWSKLTKEEKSNIIRTANDVAFLAIAIAMTVLLSGGDDDDDNAWITDFTIYQMTRFQTEILFFTPKIDETMTLLRSPFASLQVVENIGKLLYQLSDNPTEVYVRGPWKGRLKIEKPFFSLIPVMKGFYSTRDIKEQTKFLNQ
jgi:hypothetical protein